MVSGSDESIKRSEDAYAFEDAARYYTMKREYETLVMFKDYVDSIAFPKNWGDIWTQRPPVQGWGMF